MAKMAKAAGMTRKAGPGRTIIAMPASSTNAPRMAIRTFLTRAFNLRQIAAKAVQRQVADALITASGGPCIFDGEGAGSFKTKRLFGSDGGLRRRSKRAGQRGVK